jgi:hypothetical protein
MHKIERGSWDRNGNSSFISNEVSGNEKSVSVYGNGSKNKE